MSDADDPLGDLPDTPGWIKVVAGVLVLVVIALAAWVATIALTTGASAP